MFSGFYPLTAGCNGATSQVYFFTLRPDTFSRKRTKSGKIGGGGLHLLEENPFPGDTSNFNFYTNTGQYRGTSGIKNMPNGRL